MKRGTAVNWLVYGGNLWSDCDALHANEYFSVKRTWLSILVLLLLAFPVAVHGQTGSTNGFFYSVNPGETNTITIDEYSGGGAAAIPTNINGLLVVAVAGFAFQLSHATSITIPDSITNIGNQAFGSCPSLTNITVDDGNPDYSSSNGILFADSQTTLLQYPCGLGGSYIIPTTVTDIVAQAFGFCINLSNVTVPASVLSIGGNAFESCGRLTAIMVASNNSVYTSSNGVLFADRQTILVQYPGGLGGRTSFRAPLPRSRVWHSLAAQA